MIIFMQWSLIFYVIFAYITTGFQISREDSDIARRVGILEDLLLLKTNFMQEEITRMLNKQTKLEESVIEIRAKTREILNKLENVLLPAKSDEQDTKQETIGKTIKDINRRVQTVIAGARKEKSLNQRVRREISSFKSAIKNDLQTIMDSLREITDVQRAVDNVQEVLDGANLAEMGLKMDTCASMAVNSDSSVDNLTSSIRASLQTFGAVESYVSSLAERTSWELVFRVIAGTGGSAYEGYVFGEGTDSSNACKMKSVRCMYRSGVIDNWRDENIQRVLYSIKKAGKEVAFVEFFARGRTSTSWFSVGNVMDSSWTDLQGNTFNFFSIDGVRGEPWDKDKKEPTYTHVILTTHALPGDPWSEIKNEIPHSHLHLFNYIDVRYGRLFFINKSYGGCPGDVGWTALFDSADKACTWGRHSSYPAIFYANANKVEHATGFNVADEMEIYVYRA